SCDHRPQPRRCRFRPHSAVRLRRLADLVRRAHLVPCRLQEPALRHAQLGVELRHLWAQRAAHHRPLAGSARMAPTRMKGAAMKRDREQEMKALGQTVLVLQGGGALGAYQVGVYEALAEAGVEPDWVVGTSIGAINAGLIAGSPKSERIERLHEFWKR